MLSLVIFMILRVRFPIATLITISASENQFSLTRAASTTGGAAKSNPNPRLRMKSAVLLNKTKQLSFDANIEPVWNTKT
jgi:hypothetical protein